MKTISPMLGYNYRAACITASELAGGEKAMTKTVEAVYDGEALRPDEPLDLQPNTRVRITIETAPDALPRVPEKPRRSLRELFGSVDLGHPTGTDNESIDADLAREYAATHEDIR